MKNAVDKVELEMQDRHGRSGVHVNLVLSPCTSDAGITLAVTRRQGQQDRGARIQDARHEGRKGLSPNPPEP
eukprot:2916353-Rhodomonas_salina.1